MKKTGKSAIRLPRKGASDGELADFFDHHEGFDLLDQGIMAFDSDREDLERMLQDVKQP